MSSTKHTRMLEELLENHQSVMNDWQKEFCNSVLETSKKFALRPKQKAKVDEVWAEIVEGKGRQSGPVEVLPMPYKGWSVVKETKFDFYVAYKEKNIGQKMTLEDCTTVMDWLSNSDEDLISLFCNCQGDDTPKEDTAEDVAAVIDEELPEPF